MNAKHETKVIVTSKAACDVADHVNQLGIPPEIQSWLRACTRVGLLDILLSNGHQEWSWSGTPKTPKLLLYVTGTLGSTATKRYNGQTLLYDTSTTTR